jgi:eukaryotic-like serine/threonine-protein kinase
VLWGRCWEGGGAPAYWPWVQCLRSYIRSHDPAAIRDHMAGGAAEIAQVLPEIAAVVPGAGARPAAESESARFRLFDATTNFLRNAAADELMVIVIDDLQVADTPSLLLLRFLASQLLDTRVLILGTYRDVELTPEHPVAAAISEMAREPTTHHLVLRGLEMRDVALLAQRSAGLPPPPSLVLELHRQTNGNPLFVAEAIKLLASEGRFDEAADATSLRFAIPGAVRDVITRRLARLQEPCRMTLALASVLGPEMTAEALRRLAGLSFEELLETLDEAITSGLLQDDGWAAGTLSLLPRPGSRGPV